MKHPLLPILLTVIAGILAAQFVAAPPLLLLAVSFLAVLATLAWSRARSTLLGLLLFLVGWTDSTLHTAVLSPYDLRRILRDEPELVTVRGTLRETPTLRVLVRDEKESWRSMAQLEVSGILLDRRNAVGDPGLGTRAAQSSDQSEPPASPGQTSGASTSRTRLPKPPGSPLGSPDEQGGVRISTPSWQAAFGRIAVSTAGPLTNLFGGQIVEITGVIAPPKEAVAEGTFDYRSFLRQLGIYYHLRADSDADWQISPSSSRSPPLSDRFRSWARHALSLGLPGEDESLRLEWALTLGWKTALTEEVSEPFVQAATYHIFAVDGLRMAIIFGIFFGLFRAVGLPRPACGLMLLPLLWFYVSLTGWPASAIRATVMLTIVLVGWVLRRPTDLLNSLFAAALLILVWQPQQLFQAGFQLSFFVVLCLILMLPPLHRALERFLAPDPLLPVALHPPWRRRLRAPMRYLGDVFLTSLAAWVGSLPLAAYYFNVFTPVSTPANLVAVPLCALVLMANLASLLLAAWCPAAAELFNQAGWFLMECIRVSSHWFAGWPFACLYTSAPSLFTTALYYVLLLAVSTGWLFRPRFRRWRIAGLALPAVVWCALFCREAFSPRLTILPVNGGMSLFYDAPGWRDDLLVDCGTTNSVNFTTKPFLRAQGVNHLSRLLLTHGDLHHVGGAETVLQSFSLGRICISPVRFRSSAYRHIIERLGQLPNKLERLSRHSGLGQWQVMHPDPSDRFPQADDNALVLFASFHGTRVLLLSDLGRPGQDMLLERYPDLRADLVVTGLPSASEAVSDALLDSLQPRAIIVADSEFPVSERAGSQLRGRLARRNLPVIYTRSEGAVTIEFRGPSWRLRARSGLEIKDHY